jgi:Domain of unknown function (DUF1858)
MLSRLYGLGAHCTKDGRTAGTHCQLEEGVVEVITADMKVADVVRRWPETAEVLRAKGFHDLPPSVMARFMTVQSAARMEGIGLATLLEELNKVAVRARA